MTSREKQAYDSLIAVGWSKSEAKIRAKIIATADALAGRYHAVTYDPAAIDAENARIESERINASVKADSMPPWTACSGPITPNRECRT